MPRRLPHDTDEAQDRWVLSYADFITLLFAFFVVMYALSSVNEEKYKALSSALSAAFVGLQAGDGILPASQNLQIIETPTPQEDETPSAPSEAPASPDAFNTEIMDKIYQDLSERLLPFLDEQAMELSYDPLWVSFELPLAQVFSPGSLALSEQGAALLSRYATLLRPYETPIHVESYTDNTPLPSGSVFASHWELSAARAAVIVRKLSEFGIQPERLAVVGYSEYQPKYSNRTEQGREGNRRLVVVTSRDARVQRSVMAYGAEAFSQETKTVLLSEPAADTSATIEQRENTSGGLLFTQPSSNNRGEP